MKIVHVSTFDVGGAGTAAMRLHEGLLKQETDSVFLCLQKYTSDKKKIIQYTAPYKKQAMVEKLKNRLGLKKLSEYEKNKIAIEKLEGDYEKFSFPFTDYFVENDAILESADIIHLHWISDFINYPSFFRSIQKPIVWTLHDMNSILGGFHYAEDRKRNTVVFEKLENKLVTIKTDAVSKTSNLTVVTPSSWLKKLAESSLVFKRAHSFVQIPYSLDCSIYKPQDKAFARSVFNLPSDKKILLFVCENVLIHRKGFDLLVQAIEVFHLQESFTLMAAGEVKGTFTAKNFVYNTGTIKDERLMSLLYAAADLFVLPSREDNFPNVMLEALACGTPILSFKTGGMAEVVEEGVNGFFAADITAQSLADALNDFNTGKYLFDRNTISQLAAEQFSLEIQAARYKKLYTSILENRA